jgi:hypothetical protein
MSARGTLPSVIIPNKQLKFAGVLLTAVFSHDNYGTETSSGRDYVFADSS